jgi:chromosome segregation ATPase
MKQSSIAAALLIGISSSLLAMKEEPNPPTKDLSNLNIESLKTEENHLQKENKEFKNTIKELIRKIEGLEKENKELKDSFENSEKERRELENQVLELLDNKEESDKREADLNNEIQELQNELDATKKSEQIINLKYYKAIREHRDERKIIDNVMKKMHEVTQGKNLHNNEAK